MAFLNLNSAPVSRGEINLPRTGRWTADLRTLNQLAPVMQGDPITLTAQGGTEFSGVCERGGPDGGGWQALVVAGTGGLGRNIPARYYRDIPAATAVRDLLGECGEQVGEVDLPGTLGQWVRPAGPAHEALRALLLRFPERTYRFGLDGRVWVGEDAWTDAPHPLAIEAGSEDAARGRYVTRVALDVRPGSRVTFTRGPESIAKRIARVQHHIEEDRLRTVHFFADGQDVGPEALARLAEQSVRHLDYMAAYPATVLKDWGDMTLDIQPEHPRLPPMTHVRLVQAIAGARVKVKKGARVLLEFQHGDPARGLISSVGVADLECLEITTALGQTVRLDDDRGQTSDEHSYGAPHVRVQDAAGQVVELWARRGEERVTLRDRAGQTVVLDAAKGQVNVVAKSVVNIEAPVVNVNGGKVNLAGGGPAVARVGDTIQGTCPTGPVTGTIVSGSGKVNSG